MCGIYIAKAAHAEQKVLAGLKRLEYRGYDSWGIAVLDKDSLEIEKYVGKIGKVQELSLPKADVALGHTRWATHGGVTQLNAHPHQSTDGSFVLVQNGVVENYQELKATLINKSYSFISETDTEVIVHLLEEKMKKSGVQGPTLETFATTMKELAGRSTVGVLSTDGSILVYRNGSPLVVGRNANGELYFSSDVLSLAGDAEEYMTVDNQQIVVVSKENEITLFDAHTLNEVELQFKVIDVQANTIDKDGYAHFMLKEIFDQAQALEHVIHQPDGMLAEFVASLKKAKTIYTLGAGSASFVAGYIAFLLREQGLQAVELKSYEARSYKTLFTDKDVAIVISQSGETADTNEVVEWMKESGMKIGSIVNMVGSTLTALSDFPNMLQVGPEVGIASTKALSGQIVWGTYITQLLKGENVESFGRQVLEYQSHLQTWLENKEFQHQMQELAKQLVSHKDMFVLGRGQLYMSALEFALKMKEISYIHAEGFSGGELKHGVIALISSGTPVVCLIANDSEKADMLSAAAEVRARGGQIIGVAAENNELFHEWIQTPEDELFAPISSFIPAQLLTYYMAIEQGFDPDKPRNLAKSVTVK